MLAFLRLYRFNQRSVLENQRSIKRTPWIPLRLDLATVERTVSHSQIGQIGRVLFQGVSWQARCIQKLSCKPGTLVKVLYRQGNTLIVDVMP